MHGYKSSESRCLIETILRDPQWFQIIRDLIKPTEKVLSIVECLPIKNSQDLEKRNVFKLLGRSLSHYTGVRLADKPLRSTSYLLLSDVQLYYFTFQNGKLIQQFVFYRAMMDHIRFSEVKSAEIVLHQAMVSGKNCKKLQFKADGERWEIICYNHIFRSPFQQFANNPDVNNQLHAISANFSEQVLTFVYVPA